jgi:hypothetical protein
VTATSETWKSGCMLLVLAFSLLQGPCEGNENLQLHPILLDSLLWFPGFCVRRQSEAMAARVICNHAAAAAHAVLIFPHWNRM